MEKDIISNQEAICTHLGLTQQEKKEAKDDPNSKYCMFPKFRFLLFLFVTICTPATFTCDQFAHHVVMDTFLKCK